MFRGQVLLTGPSLPNLQSLPTRFVFLLEAQRGYYGFISKEERQKPWNSGAWKPHKAAIQKRNVFCSLSH